jgi:ribokinase
MTGRLKHRPAEAPARLSTEVTMTTRPRLAVLGSLNMDISVPVGRLPGPGETVLGGQAVIAPGGKGANQAVAAARLGAATTMAGCVGADEFGGPILLGLAAEGIDVNGVRKLPGVATGLALITVSADGENMITVAPGANGECGPAEADAALAGPPGLLVISAEIPPAAIAAALAGAARRGVPVLLNLAPVPADAEAAARLAAGAGWLVVNESEAAALLGRPVAGLAGATEAAGALRDLLTAAAGPGTEEAVGPGTGEAAAARGLRGGYAVVTAGSQGAALAGPDGAAQVPGFEVASVDAVGAGDAFVAALAVGLASGAAPPEALRAACAAGATATTRRGAQTALPGPAEIAAVTGVAGPWPAGT